MLLLDWLLAVRQKNKRKGTRCKHPRTRIDSHGVKRCAICGERLKK